jgi:hypothetical protein
LGGNCPKQKIVLRQQILGGENIKSAKKLGFCGILCIVIRDFFAHTFLKDNACSSSFVSYFFVVSKVSGNAILAGDYF